VCAVVVVGTCRRLRSRDTTDCNAYRRCRLLRRTKQQQQHYIIYTVDIQEFHLHAAVVTQRLRPARLYASVRVSFVSAGCMYHEYDLRTGD